MQFTVVHRAEKEKVFISVQNNEGAVLVPGVCVEFTPTTTAADQGRLVEVVDAAINLTTGIAAKVAGVVETTISTGDIGRVQVYGPANVRASSSIAVSRMVVATSAGVSPTGVAQAASQTSTIGLEYLGARLGWTLENGPNATNSTVFLECM